MIITGIAHPPQQLHERTYLPSSDLVYLAKRGLKEYGATRLITSLSPGWEQALTKAAIELGIPFTVAIPYPGRDAEWKRDARTLYLDLLARAASVYRINDCYTDTALIETHHWRVDRSELLLTLWDYKFEGETFQVMNYALMSNQTVVNLWEDWYHLYNLRRKHTSYFATPENKGARVFESNA